MRCRGIQSVVEQAFSLTCENPGVGGKAFSVDAKGGGAREDGVSHTVIAQQAIGNNQNNCDPNITIANIANRQE